MFRFLNGESLKMKAAAELFGTLEKTQTRLRQQSFLN
jgi:hypothetical protein